MLQFGDVDGLPAFGGPDQDRIDQLQAAFLGTETRQGFGPQALLDKGVLNQVGRPDKFTMGPRQLQMIQQRVQVFTEDTAQRGQLLANGVGENPWPPLTLHHGAGHHGWLAGAP